MDEKRLEEYLGGIMFELRQIRLALTGGEVIEDPDEKKADTREADQAILAEIIAQAQGR